LLSSQKRGIVKEACWAISNITAGTVQQIGAVIDANIIPLLVHLLATAEFDIKKEVAWALSNACSQGSSEQVAYFCQQGLIRPLIDLLEQTDMAVIKNALEALEHVLIAGEKLGHSQFATDIEDAGGLDMLEELQDHQNQAIYKKAIYLLETYFGAEEEGENTAEVSKMTSVFKFPINSPTNSFAPSSTALAKPFQPTIQFGGVSAGFSF